MKENSPSSIKFVLNILWISIMLNTSVVSPHILTAEDKAFSFYESLNIILLIAGISAAIFLASSIVLYIFTLLTAKMNRERAFWILMIVGIATAVFADHLFSSELAKYNKQTGWISAIAGFSIMSALASQYQLFLGKSEDTNSNLVNS